MREQESQAIRQSMSDGYFQEYGKRPRESEINACIKFFEEVAIIKATKTPETVDEREEELIVVYYMVMNRKILISNFNLETNKPSFIKNTIRTQ